MKKSLLIVSLLFIIPTLFSQEISRKKELIEIVNSYTKELQLNTSQKRKFKKVIFKYDSQFQNFLKENIDNDNNKYHFNKLLKEEVLEIYDFLTKKQFSKYKKLKKLLEPKKTYQI